MERKLNFEGMIPHLFLKARQLNYQIGKIPCPRFIKCVKKKKKKKKKYWPYPAYRCNRIMTGATVPTQILSSSWFSLLINT